MINRAQYRNLLSDRTVEAAHIREGRCQMPPRRTADDGDVYFCSLERTVLRGSAV
jgi:hypothetical protein